MTDEDALKDEDITSGTQDSDVTPGDLPDEGIEGTPEAGTDDSNASGDAGPASGTTEGDDAVGIV